ncbi:MAG: hypothetical protein WBM21_02865, partial [Christensenellales bacterium]
MKPKGRSTAFKREFFTKLTMVVMLALVITFVLVFALPKDPIYAYSVTSEVVYDRSDYSIASYFESGDTINTGASAFAINISHSSLENYVGSYWVINNSGYSASLTTVNSNTYRILDTDNIFSGEDTVYTVVNIPIPQNLRYLFQLGLVSNVTFSAKAQTQARSIDFAVGVSVGERHTPTADNNLTGETSSGTGAIHKSSSTSS